MADEGSMLNTPPTFGWYFAGLVFKWLKKQGGLKAMEERNRAKAEKLYGFIEGSGFYKSPVAPNARSWMNVPFTLAKPDLDKAFCAEAAKVGLVNLEGHRSVGGMRASIYNAMSIEGVEALVNFMKDFQKRNGKSGLRVASAPLKRRRTASIDRRNDGGNVNDAGNNVLRRS